MQSQKDQHLQLQGSSKGHGDGPQQDLPPIPDKLYFTIGEASALCLVKPHVLRYWEQEFSQLSPSKRRGNRRYYQRDEIVLIRHIRDLLYEQGFTIEGAKSKLASTNGDGVANIETNRLIKNVLDQLTDVLTELERK